MSNEHPFQILFICFLISISFQGVVTAETQEVLSDYQVIIHDVGYTGNESLRMFEHSFYAVFSLSKGDNISFSLAIPPEGEDTFFVRDTDERPVSPNNRTKRDSLSYVNIDTKVKESTSGLFFYSISSNVNYSFSQPIDIFWPPHTSQQFFKIVAMNESTLLNLSFDIKILENVSNYWIHLLSFALVN